MSKLPKMSHTPPPPSGATPPISDAPWPTEADEAASRARAAAGDRISTGAEAWISIAVGVILLLMQQTFVLWCLDKLGLAKFETSFIDERGNPITYAQSVLFTHDMGLVVFAIALVLDGVVLLCLRRAWVVATALAITILATAWNLFTVIVFYPGRGGYKGLQIMPALAVAFGVYVAIYQWRLLKSAKSA